MRLRCNVKVCSRVSGTSAGAFASRSSFSTLTLVKGARNPQDSYLIHFSTANKFGKRYRLEKNIARLFTRFINEGKTTVSFREPEHNLLIQADPTLLKAFVATLRACLKGNSDGLSSLEGLSSLGAVPKTSVPTRLIVNCVADLPVKSLPRTLETLHLIDIGMTVFKREILTLRNLHTLNLSCNYLQKLPPELGKMPCLKQLDLNKNELGCAPTLDWRWMEGPQITNTLISLDLSCNHLNILPKIISKLKNLATLKLDNNNLSSLPMGIGSITSLRYLSASKNSLSILPANISRLRLAIADFSGNNLNHLEIFSMKPKFEIVSLVDLCSSVVIENKIPYSNSTIPYTLVSYLNSSNYCICGKSSFSKVNYARIALSFRSFCESITTDGFDEVCFECYVCSLSCYNNYFNRKRNIKLT